MKRKSTARSALITSIISLLLCVSMLVGTTFAWFTDEVVTGMNTIAAGNLDVELLANGVKVEPTTKLFDDVVLWEPGVVTYEKLQVTNVGTLALEYQLTMNFGSENDLNGHKLSEVLQVAVIDGSKVNMTDRAEVLAAAQAATESEVGAGLLANFNVTGELLPKGEPDGKDVSKEMTVVIFWAPNDNAKDNLYNANNGQKTSDGKPLHIEFGVKLQATQMVEEKDSFGNDYDMSIDNTPYASIVPLGSKAINATAGIGGNAEPITLDAAYQYEPTLTFDEAQKSAYKYYKADFYVYADKDVPAESLALAGYYSAWCDLPMQGGNWVALSSPDTITAGTGIRLIEAMGGGSIAVHYKDICQYGNDGIGFLCGLVDLTGENAGTTITVELRLYATDADPAGSSASNNETGEYFTVATAKYTFPAAPAADDAALDATLASGISSVKLAEGNYSVNVPAALAGKDITLEGSGDNTVVDFTKVNGANGANITFKNMKFQGTNANVMNGFGIQGTNGHIAFENCTFDGAVTNEYFGTVSYTGCTFTGTGYITTYAVSEASFEKCVFDKADSRALLVYSHGDNPCVVTVTDCEFKAAAKATTWAGDWTAAVEIDTTNIPTAGTSVTITNCTADSNYSGIYRDKSTAGKANAVITVN